MGFKNGTFQLVVVALLIIFSITTGWAEDNNDPESVETLYLIQISTGGIGYDQKTSVTEAFELIKLGKLAQADGILDNVHNRFNALMNSNRKYVCFRRTEDYRQFLNEIEAKQGRQAIHTYTLVHYSFAQVLYFKAFIASSQKQWSQAIKFLDREISYAPYDPQPHNEKGYILNRQKKHQQALKSYKKAYTLATYSQFSKN
ncbi:MAG: hypothetical protein WA277_05640 [Nitrospirota bacterium]